MRVRCAIFEAIISEMPVNRNRALWQTLWLFVTFCTLGLASRAQGKPPQPAGSSTPEDTVVMTVGEKKITVNQLCSAMQTLPPPQRTGYALHPELVRQWYGPLVALAEEARREHLGAGGLETKDLSEVDRDNALAGELIQALSRQAEPAESEIENFYQAHKSEFEEVRARHILVAYNTALASRSSRTAGEAKARVEEIASELQGGADFQALAATESDDLDTRAKAGDLGYVRHHQLEPEVDEVLWSLSAGQTSPPFEGRFGYEILRAEERRSLSLASVRESIIGRIKADVVENREREIVAAAHITMERTYLNSALPCQPPSRLFTLPDRLDVP